MVGNWGFEYEGVEYEFIDISKVTENVMPHGETLEHGGCGSQHSPTDDEKTKRHSFNIKLQGIETAFAEWKENIRGFNFASAEAMQIDNFNNIEENWNQIVENLQRLTESLDVARTHIMNYKDEFRERNRICSSKGWWRDVRDSNREFNYEVKSELAFAETQRHRAISIESGVIPSSDWVPPSQSNGDSGGNGGDGGDEKGYSPTEEKLILVGKILLGILAVYFGYRFIKKFKK